MLHHKLAIASLLLSAPSLAQVHYADANLTTGLDDGSSWDDAFQGPLALREAVLAAQPGERVFAAEGRYFASLGNASGSIPLRSGIEIHGGFAGGESSPDERPPLGSAPSVVDGDFQQNGSRWDNTIHLFSCTTGDASAVLDRFTIENAYAGSLGGIDGHGAGVLCGDFTAPTILDCRFENNYAALGGSAVYIGSAASPRISGCSFEGNERTPVESRFSGAVLLDRCVFRDNTSGQGHVGAVLAYSSNMVTITNSLFEGNKGGTAGAIYGLYDAGITLENCTVVGNQGTWPNSYGGLRAHDTDSISVTNSLLWGNTGMSGQGGQEQQIHGLLSKIVVNHTLVEGGFAGTGNLDADPLFADPAAGDFSLSLQSPAIDAGDSSLVDLASFDLDRRPRRADEPGVPDTGAGDAPIVDMGAYERSIGHSDPGCEPLANSAGTISVLTATGSVLVSDNDVNLAVHGLPPQQSAYFLLSETTASLPVASGILCLGAPQLRFSKNVLTSSPAGSVAFAPDLTQLPQGQVVQAGETWFFQLWHRDGATSNFSGSLVFTWE